MSLRTRVDIVEGPQIQACIRSGRGGMVTMRVEGRMKEAGTHSTSHSKIGDKGIQVQS